MEHSAKTHLKSVLIKKIFSDNLNALEKDVHKKIIEKYIDLLMDLSLYSVGNLTELETFVLRKINGVYDCGQPQNYLSVSTKYGIDNLLSLLNSAEKKMQKTILLDFQSEMRNYFIKGENILSAEIKYCFPNKTIINLLNKHGIYTLEDVIKNPLLVRVITEKYGYYDEILNFLSQNNLEFIKSDKGLVHFYKLDIVYCPFSVVTYRSLKSANIHTVGQFLKLTISDMQTINLSSKSIDEILEISKEYALLIKGIFGTSLYEYKEADITLSVDCAADIEGIINKISSLMKRKRNLNDEIIKIDFEISSLTQKLKNLKQGVDIDNNKPKF